MLYCLNFMSVTVSFLKFVSDFRLYTEMSFHFDKISKPVISN